MRSWALPRLRPWPGCVIVLPLPRNPSLPMRLASSSIVVIASWLLVAQPAEATAAHGGSKRVHRLHSCKQRTAFGHQPRHLGPLRAQSIAERAGLGDTRAVLKHAHHARQVDDDDAVIQNNVPADRVDDGRRIAPALQPLGTLASSHTALPSDRILTRRSPRGPPLF